MSAEDNWKWPLLDGEKALAALREYERERLK